ncbi:DUF4189 domain-containing protein [Nocardia sp. NPDC005978]|uniref:DUF4189 domain-containing protein n=1 Tax=unclassified Nocardia TaxID=2637762 RepID=UPI0033B65AA3
MKKIVSGAAVMVATIGSLLAGTTAPATAQYAQNYGAIALSPSTGRIGYSADYGNTNAAQDGAMSECSYNDCRVVAWFSNGCGAVAYSSRTRMYTYGANSSRAAARTQALNRNGAGASVIHWNCTSGYSL